MNHGRARIHRTVVLAWLMHWRFKIIPSNKLRWLFLHLLQDIKFAHPDFTARFPKRIEPNKDKIPAQVYEACLSDFDVTQKYVDCLTAPAMGKVQDYQVLKM